MATINLLSAFETDHFWASRSGAAQQTESGEYSFVNSAGYFVRVLGSNLTYSGDAPAGGTYFSITVFTDVSATTTVAILDFAAGTNADFATYFTDFATTALGSVDTVTGSGGDDVIKTYGGNDIINAGGGNDVVDGGAGNDGENGGTGSNTATFASATSGVTADLANPVSNTGDAIGGYANIQNLIGSNFADILRGDAGTNTLSGGRGKDTLTGGSTNDTFDFNAAVESKKGATRDVITDFSGLIGGEHDQIDLASIDAKKGPGNQAFHFIGKQAFHDHKGELHYVKKGGFVLVEGDINGDGKADFQIEVHNLANNLAKVQAGDFIA